MDVYSVKAGEECKMYAKTFERSSGGRGGGLGVGIGCCGLFNMVASVCGKELTKFL